MKRIIFFALSFIFAHLMLNASPVDTLTARQAAANFLSQHGATRSTNALQMAYQLNDAAQNPCVYIFNSEGGGFVVTAADNSVLPVLGYSTTGHFDTQNIPSNVAAWLDSYRDAVSDIAAGASTRAYPTMEEAWQQLLANEPAATSREVVVGPLLTTTWNQSPYYNQLCPGTGNNKAITGCVATAMGQIMRYWQWPAQGHGSHTYVANYGDYGYADYGSLYANFGEATYNYNLMPDYLNSSSSSNQIGEVAKLLYHCGVSVNMMYSPSASGANSENVPSAMHNYFGYTSSTFQYKSGETSWVNALKTQLNADRPVYYSGSGDDGGHAFVCDGYDEDNYFHFNWGWSGSHNGYFAVSNLNPGSYVFNTYQGAIFNLEPDLCYPYPEISISGNTVMADANSSVTLTAPEGVSYQWSNNSTDQSITVSPAVPKYYTVTVTDTAGCRNTASTWVTFADGCEITFHLHDSYGDSWQGNTIQVFNRVTKIAEITLDDGSDATITLPVISGELALRWKLGNYPEECSFEVNGHCFEYICTDAPQSTGVFFVTQLFCGDIVTEFSVETEDGQYTWNDITYYESGDYQQTFTTPLGCDSTAILHLTLHTNGIANPLFTTPITLYPNPTNNKFTVQYPTNGISLDNAEIQLFDAFGKLLLRVPVTGETTEIDLSDFASSIYLVKWMTDGNVMAVGKVVKR
jgi:hypothetical protein